MVISKELKRELVVFMMTISAMLVTKNITDLEAIEMILEKLLALVKKEIDETEHVTELVDMLPTKAETSITQSGVASVYATMSNMFD
jgi:hypothetical protein